MYFNSNIGCTWIQYLDCDILEILLWIFSITWYLFTGTLNNEKILSIISKVIQDTFMRSPIVTLPDAFLKSCSIVNFVAKLDNFMITSHFFGNLKFIGVRYKKKSEINFLL
jgi:hypothetical protein